MAQDSNDDLTRWLDRVTRGLPVEINHQVRDEITAHYEDAVSEQQAQGQTPSAAHRMAMAELGDDEATGQMFHDVHRAERHYLRAAFASVVSPITIPLVLVVARLARLPPILSMIVLFLTAFLTTIYVLHAFRVLLIKNYNFHRLKLPVALLILGVGVITGASIGSLVFLGHPLALFFSAEFLARMMQVSDRVLRMDRWLSLTVEAGMLLLGAGFILMGDRLFDLKDSLFGLRPSLLYALIASGFSILCLGFAAIMGVPLAAGLAGASIVVAGLILQVLITLLFMRAGLGRSIIPGQPAKESVRDRST